MLEFFRDRGQLHHIGDPDIFVFKHAVTEEDQFMSLWYLGFFRNAGFIVSVIPGDALAFKEG